MARKSTFGSVDRLPSGRYRARYTGPDGRMYSARTAANRPLTFDTHGDADAFLARTRTAVSKGTWTPPGRAVEAPVTLRAYAAAWLPQRQLQTRTRELYAALLNNRILPTFGDVAVRDITPAAVRTWHAAQQAGTPTAAAHAYSLLRTILGTAVSDDLLPANPCRIRGAGAAKTAKRPRPATLEELAALRLAMPERYKATIDLACWCSLRLGEVVGLQRGDLDLDARVLRVRRSVARTRVGLEVKAPKSAAGARDVTIPPHIVEGLREHLKRHAEPGTTGLVFPAVRGGHLSDAVLRDVYLKARAAAGRPDLRFHDLRHTGQTYAAAAGANLRELMARAGQSTPGAALRYLHEVDGRQREIADRLAAFASASNVTPIKTATTRKRNRSAG